MKASELAGNFEVALRRVADYQEKEAASLKKAKRALVYPSAVLVLALGVTILLTTVVLPAMSKLFTELGGELPWTTRAVTAVGAFFLVYKFYLLGALAGLAALVYGYTRLPAGKRMMDTLALKAPVFGEITLQRSMYRFCQTAAMLLRTGIPLTQIVNTVAGTIGNSLVRQAFRDVRDNLVQGQGLSSSMAKNPVFPQLLVEMVVVGETSGALDSTLASMADLYEQRVEQKIQTLTAMIEPVLITIVGLVVAFIAVSMITPLYSILQTL
jgi:type IV pilus assembly protein PilC